MIPDWILTEPAVVDDQTQYYIGRKYTLTHSKRYFTDPVGRLLHRVIWSMNCGDIPEGQDIHHVDGNPHNNSLLNLQMLSHSEHARMHTTKKWQIYRLRKCQQ